MVMFIQYLNIKRLIKWMLLCTLFLLCIAALVVAGVLYAAKTDAGTQRLLQLASRVLPALTYQHVQGNMVDGLSLSQLQFHTEKVDVAVDHATLRFGFKELLENATWRQLLSRRSVAIHTLHLHQLKITQKTPPSDKAFEFKPIRLPVELHLRQGIVDELRIQAPEKTDVVLEKINIERAVWKDTRLSIHERASLMQAHAQVSHLQGFIDFKNDYPLSLKGQVALPDLVHMGNPILQINALGSLKKTYAIVNTHWQGALQFAGQVEILEKNVPYAGVLTSQDWKVPAAEQENIHLKALRAKLAGNMHGLGGEVDTQLSSVHAPTGRYRALLHTNFKQLMVHQLSAQTQQGNILLSGRVGWQQAVRLQLKGYVNAFQLTKYVPHTALPYVPNTLNAYVNADIQFAHAAQHINVQIAPRSTPITDTIATLPRDFVHPSSVQLQLHKPQQFSSQTPYHIQAQLRNWTQPTPFSTVKIQQGQLDMRYGQREGLSLASTLLVASNPSNKNILSAHTTKNSPFIHIPAGQYNVQLNIPAQTHHIVLDRVTYQGQAGHVQAAVHISQQPIARAQATETQLQIKLQDAALKVQDILPQAPIRYVSGRGNVNIALGQGNSMRITAQQVDVHTQLDARMLFKQAANPALFRQQAAQGLNLNFVGNADVALSNAMQTIRGNVQGVLQAHALPSTQLSTEFTLQQQGNNRVLSVPRFALQDTLGQHVNASGHVQLGALGYAVQLQTQQFSPQTYIQPWVDLGLLAPLGELPQSISGQVATHGEWNALQKRVHIQHANLTAMYRNHPLRVSGGIDIHVNHLLRMQHAALQQWSRISPVAETEMHTKPSYMAENDAFTLLPAPNQSVVEPPEKLQVQLGQNELTLVHQPNTVDYTATIDAPLLSDVHTRLSGSAQGTLYFNRGIVQPKLRVNQLRFNQLGVKQIVLEGIMPLVAGGADVGHLRLDVQQVTGLSVPLKQIALTMVGNLEHHQLVMASQLKNARAGLVLIGGYDPEKQLWQGVLENGRIKAPQHELLQQQSAPLQIDLHTQEVRLGVHCWRGAGQLCISQPLSISANKGHVVTSVEGLDMQSLAAFMPAGLFWQGMLSGSAMLHWQKGTLPQLVVNAQTKNGNIGLTSDDPADAPLLLAYQHLGLMLKTEQEGVKMRFDMRTPGIGTGYIDAIIDPKPSPKTINGALVLDNIKLDVFKVFLPQLRTLTGVASLAGGMSGKLSGPDFYGEFRLRDGAAIARNLPVNIQNASLKSSIRGGGATLDGQFSSGKGIALLTGKLDWLDDLKINVDLKGDQLEFKQAPTYTFKASPKLTLLVAPVQKKLSLKGDIDIPAGEFAIPETTNNGISRSADVVVVDPAVEAASNKKEKPRVWDMDNRIEIYLGKQNYFRGFGAQVPLVGGMLLTQRGASPMSLLGEVSIREQTPIQAYGQTMLLRRGTVSFTGSPMRPELDIELSKIIENRTLGISLYGSALDPKMVFFNNAGLNDQETLNALVTGSISRGGGSATTTGFKTDANNTATAAGLSYLLGGSRGVTGAISKMFGLSNLTLDAEGNQNDTSVNVTGYLTPDLYIRYGMGVFTPVNKLTIRYQLNRRTYLEATSSLEKAIDLFYNWRF